MTLVKKKLNNTYRNSLLMFLHMIPQYFLISKKILANRTFCMFCFQIFQFFTCHISMGLDQMLIQRFELGKKSRTFQAFHTLFVRLSITQRRRFVPVSVRFVHGFGHERFTTLGMFAGVSRPHFDLDGLEAGHLMSVVNMVPMGP